MTTSKPEVKRYDCTSGGRSHCYGCYAMTETEDGYYVSAEDYEALQAECEKLRKDAERYRYIKKGNQWIIAATKTGFQVDGEDLDDLIDSEMGEQNDT